MISGEARIAQIVAASRLGLILPLEGEEFWVALNRAIWIAHDIRFNAYFNAVSVIEWEQVSCGIEPGEAA